jgi:hypothetical protein
MTLPINVRTSNTKVLREPWNTNITDIRLINHYSVNEEWVYRDYEHAGDFNYLIAVFDIPKGLDIDETMLREPILVGLDDMVMQLHKCSISCVQVEGNRTFLTIKSQSCTFSNNITIHFKDINKRVMWKYYVKIWNLYGEPEQMTYEQYREYETAMKL